MTVTQFQSHLAEFTTAAGGAALTVDWAANGFSQNIPLSAAVCTLTFTAPKTDAVLVLHLTQDATGGRAVVLPGSVVGALALSPAPNSSTIVQIFYTKGTYYVVASSSSSSPFRDTFQVDPTFTGTSNGSDANPFPSHTSAIAAAIALGLGGASGGALLTQAPLTTSTEIITFPTTGAWVLRCEHKRGAFITGNLVCTGAGGTSFVALDTMLVSGTTTGDASSGTRDLFVVNGVNTGAVNLTSTGGLWRLVANSPGCSDGSGMNGSFGSTVSVVGSLEASNYVFFGAISFTAASKLVGCRLSSGSIGIGGGLLIQDTVFGTAPTFTGAAVVTMDGFSHASALAAGGVTLAGGATLVILNDSGLARPLTLEYWVDAAAPAGGNGADENPFQTVQQAINAAGANSVSILLARGTYAGAVAFPIPASGQLFSLHADSAVFGVNSHVISGAISANINQELIFENITVSGNISYTNNATLLGGYYLAFGNCLVTGSVTDCAGGALNVVSYGDVVGKKGIYNVSLLSAINIKGRLLLDKSLASGNIACGIIEANDTEFGYYSPIVVTTSIAATGIALALRGGCSFGAGCTITGVTNSVVQINDPSTAAKWAEATPTLSNPMVVSYAYLNPFSTLSAPSQAQGDLAIYDGATWNRLGAGAAGTYLKTQGVGANPIWSVVPGGIALTTTAPVNVTKAAAAVGTAADAARQDHKHDIATAAASGAVAIASAAAEGTATTLARSDHVHPVAAAGVPVDAGTANAAGAATTFAASDHVHNIPFGPVNTALAAANASISVNAQRITNLANPTSSQDAATKAYVDALVQGLSPKTSVIALSLTNIATLAGLSTIVDGVALNTDGMRVLLNGQTLGSQNGILIVHAGAWTRSTDMAVGSDAAGSFTFVEEGTAAGSGWVCANAPGAIVGTVALSFTQFSGAGEIIAGTGLAKSVNTLSIAFAGGAPANVTKAAASAGTSSDAARLDHKHDISTATAGSIGAANSEGTGSALARNDHTHAVVDLAIAGQVQGDTIFYNGANWLRLAAATAGQFLKTLGAGANPAWATPNASQLANDAIRAPGTLVSDALDNLLNKYPRGTYAIGGSITLDFTNIGKLGLVSAAVSANVAIPTGGTVGAKFDILLYGAGSSLSTSGNAGVNAHNLTFQSTRFLKVSLECIATGDEWLVSWAPFDSSDLADTSTVGGANVAASLSLLHASTAASLSGSGMAIPLVPFLNSGFSGGLTDDWRGTNAGGNMGISLPLYPNIALQEITLTIEPNAGHGGILPSGMPFLQVWTSSTFAPRKRWSGRICRRHFRQHHDLRGVAHAATYVRHSAYHN